MKHILLVLSLVCGADIAMAFAPGVPPHSGPGSAFYQKTEAIQRYRRRNPNESTNKRRAPACATYSRNNHNKRHLLNLRSVSDPSHRWIKNQNRKSVYLCQAYLRIRGLPAMSEMGPMADSA
jgi:hypothetical protein